MMVESVALRIMTGGRVFFSVSGLTYLGITFN